MKPSIFDEAVRDYHQEQIQLSYVNGTTDQFVYNFDLYPDSTTHTPSREEIEQTRQTNAELRNDAEHQRGIRNFFGHIAMGYSDYWKRDKTPPEKRDRLFYARRYASLFEVCNRKAESIEGMPSEEWTRFDRAAERYSELVSILEGKTPQEHYQKRWGFNEINWRYWPKAKKGE